MNNNSKAPTFTKAHFIGIGGAGMSGIALVLAERGCQVSGSDLKESRYVRSLKRAGISVFLGHSAKNINAVKPDVVVTSTAIRPDNPELLRALELAIPVWPRAKMLSELANGKVTIAVAGTHGKTTTSSMIASMLSALNLDPSFLVGGIVEGFDTNGKNGTGELYVAEADESDASFLYMNPQVAVVTNIEADHLDHYESLEEIEKTFVKFMDSVPADGALVVCAENPRVVELAASTYKPLITYGTQAGVDMKLIPSDTSSGLASTFFVQTKTGERAEVTLQGNPGRHNQLNACAALGVAVYLGIPLAEAARALSQFKGAKRRFTYVGKKHGVTVVDDYGHHPTEIKATLAAAKSLGFSRVCVLFQTHRFSRTEALMDDFDTAFEYADHVYVLDIFSAGETPIPGVTAKRLAHAIANNNGEENVSYLSERAVVAEKLTSELHEGDLLLTMGAGDVTLIGPEFLEFG